MLQGRVLYIANISKTMKMIVNDSSNTLSWSAPWAPPKPLSSSPQPDGPDAEQPKPADQPTLPTLQMVRFQLSELKAEVEKLQEKME